MEYPISNKYDSPEFMSKIMGPNPIKLLEELMQDSPVPSGAITCDLGSGAGLTSVFLAKEYGLKVYACDLWSDPAENQEFFASCGLSEDQCKAVKADASEGLPFEEGFFDAVISSDSYNYFGRDTEYLDAKLLPFVKSGGYILATFPGMKRDLHDNLPAELLLSWNAEQLDYLHDTAYWTNILSQCKGAEIVSIYEMESMDEVWADWLAMDNEYAVGDRASMEAGGGKYLNFVAFVMRKK